MIKKTTDFLDRKMFDEIPNFTQIVSKLIKEGLESEGIMLEG